MVGQQHERPAEEVAVSPFELADRQMAAAWGTVACFTASALAQESDSCWFVPEEQVRAGGRNEEEEEKEEKEAGGDEQGR